MINTVALDIVTIIVMSVTVYFAVKLNRALARARDGRVELTQLIASLSEALLRSDIAIKNMKATATDHDLALQRQAAISRSLIDELSMINDTSNTLANRLEKAARWRHGDDYDAQDQHPASKKPMAAAAPRGEPLRAERPAFNAASAASIVPFTAGSTTHGDSEAPNRSRAERELYEAIETLRRGGASK